MQSLIIIGEKKQGLELIAKQRDTFPEVDPFDLLLVEPDPSIGIDAIRAAQSFLITPPIKSTQKRIIVINAHLLTLEAQNSMLKMLEEPQAYSQIVLITNSLDALLATIQSRCHIITLAYKTLDAPEKMLELARSFEQATISEKIALVQTLTKTKPDTKEAIEGLILAAHHELIANKSPRSVKRIELLFDALTKLKTNTNNRLLLEHIAFTW
jgi:DNA polymerase III delta prime subunit